MSEQPTALRLADELRRVAKWSDSEHWDTLGAAAAELRRLHEEVQEQCRINGMGAERELKLLTEKRELLEALKLIAGIENKMWGHDWEEIDEARVIARAAIAKAEGETK